MKVAFFGASVTQQKYDSGYVSTLKNLLEGSQQDIIQKGFGGMHLLNAGICFIQEIIDKKPQICFLDWFSTGLIYKTVPELKKYLDPIIRKLMEISCQPVFLLLEHNPIDEDRMKMQNSVKEQAREYLLDVIDLQGFSQNILRDSVHTNSTGAQIYATKIKEYLLQNQKKIIQPKWPMKNKFSEIKTIQFSKKVMKTLTLKGKFLLIGIQQTIGPFSGLILKTRDGIYSEKELIWDRWCYQSRPNMVISSSEEAKTLKIDLLQDIFDTSECKEKIDFSKKQKYLECMSIQFIGDLRVDSFE